MKINKNSVVVIKTNEYVYLNKKHPLIKRILKVDYPDRWYIGKINKECKLQMIAIEVFKYLISKYTNINDTLKQYPELIELL